MIDKHNFKRLLTKLGFEENGDVVSRYYPEIDALLCVDFTKERLIYPTNQGFTISGEFTSGFTQNENFVVFECVHRLLEKGYKPQHIELEPKWTVGHGASGGRADIMVKDYYDKSLLLIECKTAGREFDYEWKQTLINGGQILSYAKQAESTQFIALYTSDFVDDEVKTDYYIISLKDNEKLLEELSDKEPLSYEKAKQLDKEDIYKAWKETYALDYATKGIFENDIPAYEIGNTKYSLTDLNSVSSKDIQGKYHQFATILRQHNVSGLVFSLPQKTIEQLELDVQYGINEGMNTKSTGFKIFRMNEIKQGYMYDNGDMKHVDMLHEEFSKYKLEKGDVLFNRTNSIEHVGKTGIFNLDGDYCFASYLIRIKNDRTKALPEYVNLLMNSEQFQSYAKSRASKAIHQANINATIMKSIPIPIPDSFEEQEKYVVQFLEIENKINKAQEIIDGIAKRKEDVIQMYL